MCGIAGIVSGGSGTERTFHQVTDVERMLKSLEHRGPDESAVVSDGRAVLGAARLAQVDRPTSRQPMQDATGRHTLALNGEVYNFRDLRTSLEAEGVTFTTSGDTEVVLHHLIRRGPSGLADLNGQFALALWDSFEQDLLLARDRFGIAPLYWARRGPAVIFGSEVRALQAAGATAVLSVPDVVDSGVLWGLHPGRSVFAGIETIPPGSYLHYRSGETRSGRFWDFAFADRRHRGSVAEQAEHLSELLRTAVFRRMPAYGHPAVLLSGGLDSTAVLDLMRSAQPEGRIDSFSIQFSDDTLDESAFQKLASHNYATSHHQVTYDAEQIAELLQEAVLHAEMPLIRTAPASSIGLAAVIKSEGTRTVLSGEGADELFCGYDIFKVAAIRDAWAHQPNSPVVAEQLESALATQRTLGRTARRAFFESGLDARADPLFSHLHRWTASFGITRFLAPEIRADFSIDDVLTGVRDRLPENYRSWSAVEQAQYLEATYFLPSALLAAQCDRPYMAHSIEGRYPFLDNEVAEFALSLPQSSKLDGTAEKVVLKAACSEVPDAIRKRTKQPYTAPEGNVFRSDAGRRLAATFLSPKAVGKTGLFDATRVDWLLQKLHRRATSFHDDLALLWILTTQILVDSHGISDS